MSNPPKHPPKQTPACASSNATSVNTASKPENYYQLCKALAKDVKECFQVHKNMTLIAWAPPVAGDPQHVSAALYVQAERLPETSALDSWTVPKEYLRKARRDLGYLARREGSRGPFGSIMIQTGKSSSGKAGKPALFQFRKSGKDRPSHLPPKENFIPSPRAPVILFKDSKDLKHHPLWTIAVGLIKDRFHNVWENNKTDSSFTAINKAPHYRHIMHQAYEIRSISQMSIKVMIALYLAKEVQATASNHKIPRDKQLLENLIKAADNGPGEPGLHFEQGIFIWQLTENVAPNFKPPKVLSESPSSSCPALLSLLGISPSPSSGPGPSLQGPLTSQKRTNTGSGFGSASNKTKSGSSSASGSGTQGTSASGSQKASGTSSHTASTSETHTSAQQDPQKGLSGTFSKKLKI